MQGIGRRRQQHHRRPQPSGRSPCRRGRQARRCHEASTRRPMNDQRGRRQRRVGQNRSSPRRPCRNDDDVKTAAARRRERTRGEMPRQRAQQPRRWVQSTQKFGCPAGPAPSISRAWCLHRGAPKRPRSLKVLSIHMNRGEDVSALGARRAHLPFTCSCSLTCSHSHMGRCLILPT